MPYDWGHIPLECMLTLQIKPCTDSSDPQFQFKDEVEVESAASLKVKPKAKDKKRDSFTANVSSALNQFAEMEREGWKYWK